MKSTVRIIFMLVLAVIYFIVPFDLIPDHWGRPGRIDDLLFIFIIVYVNFFKPLIDEVLANRRNFRQDSSASTAKADSDDPFEILGLPHSAPFADIRNAYHEKIRQYHPDLVAKMGPEIQEVARKQTQRLNFAYETLKKRYGK